MVDSQQTDAKVTHVNIESSLTSRAATWCFVPLWIAANALGAAAGVALSNAVHQAAPFIELIIPLFILCTALSLAQGLVLTLYLRGVFLPWLFAGMALGIFMLIVIEVGIGMAYIGVSYPLALLIAGGIASGPVAFWQSVILVDRISGEGWWLPVNVVAWTVALIVEVYAGWHGIGYAVLGKGDIAQGTATVALASTINGSALAWLLSRPLPLQPPTTNHGTPIAPKETLHNDKRNQSDSSDSRQPSATHRRTPQ